MLKPLYKSTKVIFNAHQQQYEVWYRNWFIWRFDSCYKYDDGSRFHHFRNKDQAETSAIERAEAMLRTVVVWEQSRVDF